MCLNPHRNAWSYVRGKWHPWLHSCHRKPHYCHPCGAKRDKSIQLRPENNTASGGYQHLLCPTLSYIIEIIQRDMIWHNNIQFLKEVAEAGMSRWGRKLGDEKRRGRGLLSPYFSRGYWKLHHGRGPENRLAYLTNEEVTEEGGSIAMPGLSACYSGTPHFRRPDCP